MNSALFTGTVDHRRLAPVVHGFTYPLHVLALDLAELPELDRSVAGFGYNRLRPVAIHDRDYLDASPVPLEQKIRDRFREARCADAIARIVLVTMARHWHYVFNPVSFYLGLRVDGRLCCALAEVNNTFGDRHLYVLPNLEDGGDGVFRTSQAKAFHVSPFNNMQGEYAFSFSYTPGALHIAVDLAREGQAVFCACLGGRGVPLTTRNLWHTVGRHPLRTALTVPRIAAQALHLRHRHRLPVHARPEPHSPLTIIRRPPTRRQQWACRTILGLLGRIRHGELAVTLPDGRMVRAGQPHTGRSAAMAVRRYALFTRVLRGGDVGFGEAYVAGDFDTPDLSAVLEVLIANRDELSNGKFTSALVTRFVNRAGHLLRPNNKRLSRRNIFEHYDLSNEFFATFLDPSLTYSCARFEHGDEPLERAQRRKLLNLIAKLRIQPHHHVLEIGSGWGALAIEMARTTGCRVTSITISEEQRRLALERVQQAGLGDRVDIQLRDYRDVRGQFDRIVSIEMLEAVGHEYLDAYFRRLDRVLKPDGLVVLQVITIPDHRYEEYRRGCDWIQKHIFPGGLLPSLTAISRAMARGTALQVEHLENIGPHYGPTLRAWSEAFRRSIARVRALGFDEAFIRKWTYYLGYCEAAFVTRTLNNLQLVLTRPRNRTLDQPLSTEVLETASRSSALHAEEPSLHFVGGPSSARPLSTR